MRVSKELELQIENQICEIYHIMSEKIRAVLYEGDIPEFEDYVKLRILEYIDICCQRYEREFL